MFRVRGASGSVALYAAGGLGRSRAGLGLCLEEGGCGGGRVGCWQSGPAVGAGVVNMPGCVPGPHAAQARPAPGAVPARACKAPGRAKMPGFRPGQQARASWPSIIILHSSYCRSRQ
jgi:hypothetical protein